jgi:glycosyltransferase involved in cell wall biosynthesis
MNSKPFFTVITVTYNSSQFVRDAIESVLASTFTDFELIIGDDCSTDNTWGIIKEYNDPRIVKYQNETNLKEYPNRNKALNMATGEWVIFIDGDDLIYPHSLAFIFDMIQKAPDVSMLLLRWFRNNIFYPILISPRDFYMEQYFGEGFLGTAFSNVFFNRKILLLNGGVSLEHVFGDDYLRMKIALSHNMMIISDQLTFWRETPNQSSFISRKLLSSYFEKADMDYLFLNEAKNKQILTSAEYLQAKYNLSKSILLGIVRDLSKFKIYRACKIFIRYKSDFIFNHSKKKIELPLGEFTPSNLLTLEKSKLRLNA